MYRQIVYTSESQVQYLYAMNVVLHNSNCLEYSTSMLYNSQSQGIAE